MKKFTILMIVLIMTAPLVAQTAQPEFGIKFKGFVKTDVMFDTRQTVAAREGHFLLYPHGEYADINGDDIHAGANLNMLSIQTRLTGVITGPDAFGARTSGLIEGAFFGHSNSDVNGFRLRHAFVKLDWATSSLMVGQYWHPMFITEVFPGVISFNTGVPFQPFSRNPQVRFIKKMDKLYLTLTAASQRDFTSTGPAGSSSSYLRNAALPILDANLKYKSDGVVAGAGVNFKSLKPRLQTTEGVKTDSKVSSFSTMAFAKFNINKSTLKFEAIYGDNLTDLLMLGGYAVTTVDNETAEEEYTNIKTLSTWAEIICGDKIKYALFAGYTKNMGAADEIYSSSYWYARGTTIENVFRISPRIQVRRGNTQFAAEVEYTSAAYGTPNAKGEVENTTNVANIRFLFAAYLFF